MMEQLINKVALDGLHHHHHPSSPHDPLESIHGSSDSGNMSGGEMSPEMLKSADYADIKNQVQNSIRAGSKRSPAEIEEAIMRKKLRNRESAQRARDRQKARMRWLEEEVTRITGKNDQMLKENLLLRQVLGEQGQKINELLRRDEERQRRSDKADTESENSSRVSIKREHKESETASDEQPAPKKPALWRPGLDTPSSTSTKPKPSTTDDHLSKMRLNIMQEHTLPSTSTPSYSGLGFDQSRLTVPSMPYFPLGTSALSTPFQPGSLTNDSLLLAQRIRQSQVISGEQ
jgi:hypothetical protein